MQARAHVEWDGGGVGGGARARARVVGPVDDVRSREARWRCISGSHPPQRPRRRSHTCPGLRLSSSYCRSSSEMGSLGGTPSMMQPTPFPCDSPNVVTRNSRPKELPVARVVTVRREEQRTRTEGFGQNVLFLKRVAR